MPDLTADLVNTTHVWHTLDAWLLRHRRELLRHVTVAWDGRVV